MADYLEMSEVEALLDRHRAGIEDATDRIWRLVNLEWWGQNNVMWSNDFPHPNSTWPNSLKIIQRDLGHLPLETQTKVLAANVCKLYNLDLAKIPAGISTAAAAAQASA